MDYQQYVPSEALSPYIKCYWSLDKDDDEPHSRERVFPDGCIELLFHYGDLFAKFTAYGKDVIQPRSFVHGQIKSFIELEATGKIGIFSVRFHAAGFQPFVKFDVSELTDGIRTVGEIWNEEGAILQEKMLVCADNHERVRLIEKFLLQQLSLPEKYNDVVYCVDAIIASDGTITIDALSDELEIGKRHLERKFLSYVGLSQKLFSRIIRFNNALQLIEKKDFSTFTNVAHEGGFYDQAHFIRDFKEFTGLNPKQYFSENLEMAKYFNLE